MISDMEPEVTSTPKSTNAYLIPASILIAGVLVAGAVFLTKNSSPSADLDDSSGTQASIDNIKPVTADDHILGDPNAPVKIVEFSDLECPFCKRFHATMKQLMAEYGESGRVAWVYRHFPLQSIHPKAALPAAIASECAAEIGGNFSFWAYVDHYFEVTPSNDQMDLAKLPTIATDVGIDRSRFDSCFAGGEEKYGEKIAGQFQDAVDSGGQGTPYSVVIAASGQKFAVEGAVGYEELETTPYEELKTVIERALEAR